MLMPQANAFSNCSITQYGIFSDFWSRFRPQYMLQITIHVLFDKSGAVQAVVKAEAWVPFPFAFEFH